MIKLIASDMDGTLLNDDHMISEENLKAIRKAQEMGRHFTIVTDRKSTRLNSSHSRKSRMPSSA